MKVFIYNTSCRTKCFIVLIIVPILTYLFYTHERVTLPNNKGKSQETLLIHDVTKLKDPGAKSFWGQLLKEGNSQPKSSIPYGAMGQTNQVVTPKTPVLSHEKQFDEIMAERFSSRLKAAQNVCSQPWMKEIEIVKPVRPTTSKFAAGRLRWCHIPKVGTTYLGGLNKNVIIEGNRTFAVPVKKRKYFYLVREPYSRMMSGYIGKIVTNQPWWDWFGRYIIRQFRPNATDEEKKCGSDVSFPEFVKYFIHSHKTGSRKNSHFVPMYEMCNPCKKSFDFIGHLETIKDDLSYLLKYVNVSSNADFNDEAQTLKNKARTILNQKQKILRCESMCTVLAKVWWSFQVRGLISKEIQFPLGDSRCDSITQDEFVELSWDAHLKSKTSINKSKQRRDSLVELFLQVPLKDRIQVRDILAPDFKLYGYEAQPDDLFPELAKKTNL